VNEPQLPGGDSRRDFTKKLAVLAAAPLAAALPDDAAAQRPGEAIADSLLEIAKARFGDHITDAQLRDVKRGIMRNQQGAELLRRVKLTNADEPAMIFRADLP